MKAEATEEVARRDKMRRWIKWVFLIFFVVCMVAIGLVHFVRGVLLGGYMTVEEVMGRYVYEDKYVAESIEIDSRGHYVQHLRMSGVEYKSEGDIFLNEGCNLVFRGGLYTRYGTEGGPQLDPPRWERIGDTTWSRSSGKIYYTVSNQAGDRFIVSKAYYLKRTNEQMHHWRKELKRDFEFAVDKWRLIHELLSGA